MAAEPSVRGLCKHPEYNLNLESVNDTILRPSALSSFTNAKEVCHPERSTSSNPKDLNRIFASRCRKDEILRFAQDDNEGGFALRASVFAVRNPDYGRASKTTMGW